MAGQRTNILASNLPMFLAPSRPSIQFRPGVCESTSQAASLAITEVYLGTNVGRLYWVDKPTHAALGDADYPLYRRAPDLVYVQWQWDIPGDHHVWHGQTWAQRLDGLEANLTNIPADATVLPISLSVCNRATHYSRGNARVYETSASVVMYYHHGDSMLALASHADMTGSGAPFRGEGRAERARGNRHDFHFQRTAVIERFRLASAVDVVSRMNDLWNGARARGELRMMRDVEADLQAAYNEFCAVKGV